MDREAPRIEVHFYQPHAAASRARAKDYFSLRSLLNEHKIVAIKKILFYFLFQISTLSGEVCAIFETKSASIYVCKRKKRYCLKTLSTISILGILVLLNIKRQYWRDDREYR